MFQFLLVLLTSFIFKKKKKRKQYLLSHNNNSNNNNNNWPHIIYKQLHLQIDEIDENIECMSGRVYIEIT